MAGTLLTRDKNIRYSVIAASVLLESYQYKSWEHNRRLDEARAAKLAELQHQLTSQQAAEGGERGRAMSLFLPTPITFCWLADGAARTRFLIDGQHRLQALRLLAARDFDLASLDLLVCEILCESPEAMEEAFVRINSGTPVPSEYYDSKVRRVLTAFSELFARKFALALSDSARAPRPYTNLDLMKTEMSAHIPLRDAIIDGRVQADDLLELVLAENAVEKIVEGKGAKGVTTAMVARARKCDFFLGLRAGWPTAIAARAALPSELPSEDT
jgi:hypothetical protein